ncbi:hypothetical protein NPIL_382531 [Nephila pilipes]|uniref:Uncharacterized protein n=1 Tax=Nephila pilipes TaxID=299642 RepID=A0A8X6MZ43_NEPPI|nr:hypothetical protein NPIL_382531 [Nephila pilipes]
MMATLLQPLQAMLGIRSCYGNRFSLPKLWSAMLFPNDRIGWSWYNLVSRCGSGSCAVSSRIPYEAKYVLLEKRSCCMVRYRDAAEGAAGRLQQTASNAGTVLWHATAGVQQRMRCFTRFLASL